MCHNLEFNSDLYIPGDMCLFCQLWSCWVEIGVGALTLIKKHTLQLVCLEIPLYMHRSVNTDHILLNTKNMLHVCLWGVHLQ